MTSAEDHAPAQLDYAPPAPRAARIDALVLIAGLLQGTLSGNISLMLLGESRRGHIELQNATTLQHIAWTVALGMALQTGVVAILSAVALIGSLLPPGPQRRRCYIAYIAGAVALLAAVVAALLILDGANFSHRWVYTGRGIPEPTEWTLFVFDSWWYWQIPLLILIGNPVLILLAVRATRLLSARKA